MAMQVSAKCAMCPPRRRVIPLDVPRYQVVRLERGGRNRKRKLVSTVCEPCWEAQK